MCPHFSSADLASDSVVAGGGPAVDGDGGCSSPGGDLFEFELDSFIFSSFYDDRSC